MLLKYISIYAYQKETFSECYERWYVHNLTSDQVHGHSMSNFVTEATEA